jgi:aminoglycoside phosphotransferase (APT) family kinase protein
VSLFAPSVAVRARAVHADLIRTAPEDGLPVFSQGDFLPGQVLCHSSGWSVIDFDDSHYADPLSDVAAMYLGLSRELRLSANEAEHARRTYLEAYVAHRGDTFERGRWRWWLVMHQLTQLAKRLMKGRVAPGEAESVLDLLDSGEDGLG